MLLPTFFELAHSRCCAVHCWHSFCLNLYASAQSCVLSYVQRLCLRGALRSMSAFDAQEKLACPYCLSSRAPWSLLLVWVAGQIHVWACLQPVLQCHVLLVYVAVGSTLDVMVAFLEPIFICISSSCASYNLQCHAMHLWGCLVQVCAVSSLGSISCCRSNECRSADRATGHCGATMFAWTHDDCHWCNPQAVPQSMSLDWRACSSHFSDHPNGKCKACYLVGR